jgi:hypothetical protein
MAGQFSYQLRLNSSVVSKSERFLIVPVHDEDRGTDTYLDDLCVDTSNQNLLQAGALL